MRSTLEMCYQIINQYSGNLHLQLTLQGKYSHINIPNIKPETLRTLNILVPYKYTLFGSCYINLVEVKIPAPRLSSHRTARSFSFFYFSVIRSSASSISLISRLNLPITLASSVSVVWFFCIDKDSDAGQTGEDFVVTRFPDKI